MKKAVFVTGNDNKFKEVQRMLGNEFPYELERVKLDLTEIQGTNSEIAVYKAKEATKWINDNCGGGTAVIIEDSGMGIDALGGFPGPYVKEFAKMIDKIPKMALGAGDWHATATCVFAIANGFFIVEVFKAEVKGMIAYEPRGTNGFGWDTVFIPNGSTKTFAEMTDEEKDRFSPRRFALAQMKAFFASNDPNEQPPRDIIVCGFPIGKYEE